MNADQRPQTPLPELSAERIDEIEDALFADIARDRASRSAARRAGRGRVWMGGAAAAAILVVAAVIAPSVGGLLGGVAGTDESALSPDAPVGTDAGGGADGAETTDGGRDLGGASTLPGESTTGTRDIITTASATVVVDDVTVAARTVGNAAIARDGYVESMSVGTTGGAIPVDPDTGVAYDTSYPYSPEGAWITVRVPAEALPALIDELSDVGEVTASSIDRQDVTEQTVDLEARIEAAQASVDRLLELMADATTTADLLAAEAALAERQATLEAYQQQLDSLEGMVRMSALTVTLTPRVETVEANPAGFGDGLAAGWNGLVATLNGIVVALGFMIPWIAVIGVLALLVWGIVRLVRASRGGKDSPPPDSEHSS
jgi:hypothetical protein